MPEEEKKKPAQDGSPENGDDSASLEEKSTLATSDMGDADALEKRPDKDDFEQDAANQAAVSSIGWREKIIRKLGSINPYLVLFILVLLVGLAITFVVNRVNEENDPTNLTFEGSELEQDELNDLLKSEQNIGTVDQTLTVAANAIFNGKVLVKSDLDVAGNIRIGGTLILPDITIGGSSSFTELSVEDLAISGNASIEGSLTVQGGISASGDASIGGTLSAGRISAESIEFSGDLSITRHIDTGGGRPAISSGTAVGSGGTVSVSGNDISGTVTINTGGGPPAGIFARITFRTAYNNTPIVNITPVGSASGALNYYVDRTTSSFSIGTANAPNSSTTYKFDYFIVE